MARVRFASDTKFGPELVRNSKKLYSLDRSKLLGTASEVSDDLLCPGGVKPLIVDTGASQTCSGYKCDFVPETLKELPEPYTMDGIAGSLRATHSGQLRY